MLLYVAASFLAQLTTENAVEHALAFCSYHGPTAPFNWQSHWELNNTKHLWICGFSSRGGTLRWAEQRHQTSPLLSDLYLD